MQTLGTEISSPELEWIPLPTAPKETILCAGETTPLWEGIEVGGVASQSPTFTKSAWGGGGYREGKARTFPMTTNKRLLPLTFNFNSPLISINKELRLSANTFLNNGFKSHLGDESVGSNNYYRLFCFLCALRV